MTEGTSEQLDYLREQRKDLVFRRRFDTLRGSVLLLGGALAFLLLSRPDSVISRSASQETIARERARLMLDIIREDNPVIRALGLEILKTAYPGHENSWIERAEKILALCEPYHNLLAQRESLRQLLDEAELELRGEGSRIPGRGTRYETLRIEAESVEADIKQLEQLFRDYGVNVAAPSRDEYQYQETAAKNR